jgi:RHS repeat-associated protein
VHAATGLSSGATFTYDANGNMTGRAEGGRTYTQTFDAENRLVSVAQAGVGTTNYVYDGDGQLTKQVNPGGTGKLYLGVVEYELNTNGTTAGSTSYYAVPGARAVRTEAGLFYVLTDHLGSASVSLDSSGAVVAEMRYDAFGAMRWSTGSMPGDRLYTGQVWQQGIGLYYFNARWYSPYINRWIQPDSIVPSAGNPQSLNRYSLVLNNPAKYTDPTGHRECEAQYLSDCGGTAPEPTVLFKIGNSECVGICELPATATAATGVVLDAIAAGMNVALAASTDVLSFVFGLPAYALSLEAYQAVSIIPNTVSTGAGLAWAVNGLLTGDTHLKAEIANDELTVSGSLAQDTVVAGLTNYLGWVHAREPNVAAVLDLGVVAYDLWRLAIAPLQIPTFFQPQFSVTIPLPISP